MLKHADQGLASICALVAKNGEIVSEGFNSAIEDFDPTAHAEVMAIRNACRKLQSCDLSGCELYTIAEPCPLCVAAIFFSRIDRVVFGWDRSCSEKHGSSNLRPLLRDVALPIEQRTLPSKQLLADEAQRVLEEWTKSPGFPKYMKSMAPKAVYSSQR
jgi:tRNA(Arg) A34 adenosine deaminase TadA